MNRLEYFRARLDATIAPVELRRLLRVHPEKVCVIDVRNGPAELLGQRILGALQIPRNTLPDRIHRLPQDRMIVVYCWDAWCTLAAEAAVLLLERGFDVKEMSGGMKAWQALGFPTEYVDEVALASQHEPLAV